MNSLNFSFRSTTTNKFHPFKLNKNVFNTLTPSSQYPGAINLKKVFLKTKSGFMTTPPFYYKSIETKKKLTPIPVIKKRIKIKEGLPKINSKIILERNKKLIRDLYEENNKKINIRIIHPKVKDEELINFDVKSYQLNMLSDMSDYFEYRTLLELKKKFNKMNHKLNPTSKMTNRWIELAFNTEGLISKRLLNKFCELGNAKSDLF